MAALASVALLHSASATLTVNGSYEAGTTTPFTPAWTPASDSLIYNLVPNTNGSVGNFSEELTGRNPNTLTQGGSLTIGKTTSTSINYVTLGGAGGSLLTYTLPPSANGYNITNISTFGGWSDAGRDAQGYTVWVSTVSNPSNFIELTTVSYVAGNGGVPTSTKVAITDSAGGAIAQNVAAVQFNFTSPTEANGYQGYAAITVEGTPATNAVLFTINTQTQQGTVPFTPSWVLETNSLIAGEVPSTATGNFGYEDTACNVDILTEGGSLTIDSVTGNAGDSVNEPTTSPNYVTCGGKDGTGSTIIYPITNSIYGSDITNVIVYNGWKDTGRDGQYYTLSYSTIFAPTAFIPITTVDYLPSVPSTATANRVAITASGSTPLAKSVAAIRFDFATPFGASAFNNGFQGYAQIIVQGQNSANTVVPPPLPQIAANPLPTAAITVVGDQVSFTASYSNSPAATVQWLFINGTTTNILAGATSDTLTLTNLQVTNSGYYQLEGINATNSNGFTYSATAQLTVSNTPAAVGNLVIADANELGAGFAGESTNFVPTWIVPGNSLIGGDTLENGQIVVGAGNYGDGQSGGNPDDLTDGSFGFLNYWPNVGGSATLVTMGVSPAGSYITFALPTASGTGYDITNITTYGGWGDGGRDEQKYQVEYATVANPTVYNSLGNIDYLPSDPNSVQSATRVTITPASGVLAQNVAFIQFNFNLQGDPPENGWEGYSQFYIAGKPSAPVPILTQDITPLTAADVVGSQVVITAAFSGATSYQWQKNGTNIPGANSEILTLNNLQLSDTATNGGYRLLASNASGTSASRPCGITVNPLPEAVVPVSLGDWELDETNWTDGVASAALITAFAYQTSDQANFSPTWDTSQLVNSLIYQQQPSSYDPVGNFMDPDATPTSFDQAGGLTALTDGSYGTIIQGGAHPAFATCGPTAGEYVIYTLPATANGYDLTNLIIAGGWNDTGRDAQFYTVYYATIDNPTNYILLDVVSNDLVATTENDPVIRTTITPASSVIAHNVGTIYIDFTQPPGVPNGYSGYSEIAVFGTPSAVNNPLAGSPPFIVTEANQDPAPGTPPTWVIETNSLIEHQLPSSVGPGAFAGSFNGEVPAGGLPVLTDGTYGDVDTNLNYATCGADYGAGQSITYSSAYGWNLTNIVVYSGWANYNRDGQFYTISYSTLAAPTVFTPLISVEYNPPTPAGVDGTTSPSANRVDIAPATGIYLATNVAAVTFDFTLQGAQDNGYSGYAEIVLQGSSFAPPVAPAIAAPVYSGGNVILTASGGTPGASYTWLTSTNLATPVANWTVSAVGILNGTGGLSNSVPVNVTNPASFFLLEVK